MIRSPQQLGVQIEVIEDGQTAEENAVKKASAYADAANLPAFAIDAALTIDGFPPEKQPGVFVRRIYQADAHVADADIIDYYAAALQACNSPTPGRWSIAAVLALGTGEVLTVNYFVHTLFVAQRSPVQIPGAPLSSLMLDPVTMRYYAEFGYEERPDSVQLREALMTLFQQL